MAPLSLVCLVYLVLLVDLVYLVLLVSLVCFVWSSIRATGHLDPGQGGGWRNPFMTSHEGGIVDQRIRGLARWNREWENALQGGQEIISADMGSFESRPLGDRRTFELVGA